MPARKSSPEEDGPRSFEDALARLDAVVAKLEEDKLPLEDMLKHYEEGVALARFCEARLEAAEQKVRLITRQADGSVALEPFADDDAES